MLIKLYTITGDLHIIEDVTDVSVLAEMEAVPNPETYQHLTSEDAMWGHFIFDEIDWEESDVKDPHAKVIKFAKDGPKKLFVLSKAYICNDEGRTLEKVLYGPAVC